MSIRFQFVEILFYYIYNYKQDMFIKIFGTKLFYRIDRLIMWKNNDSMQLTNALAATGSTSLSGW